MVDGVPGDVNGHPGPVARVGRFGGVRRVRFALHEAAEYVVAAALVAVGTRASGATELLLVVAGAALLLVGVVTDGKLGALSWLSRRSHHLVDLVVVAALALCPAVFFAELHLVGTVVAELVAVVLLRIERGTLYVDVPRRPADALFGRSGGQAAASTDPRLDDAAPVTAQQVGETAQRIGAATAVAATAAAAAAAQLGPVAGRAARIGFRSMGIVTGATRKAARDHRAERGRPGR